MTENENPSGVRCGLADDDPLVRRTLKALLRPETGVEVVWTAADGQQAVEQCLSDPVDVLLTDISMPVLDGIATLEEVTASCPDTAVVMLTAFDTIDYVHRALNAGARGFLSKADPPEVIAAALRNAKAGEFVFSQSPTAVMVAAVVEQPGPVVHHRSDGGGQVSLTRREMDVLQLVARAQQNKQIARALGISAATVKTHLSTIMGKIGVSDRVGAAVWALEHGIR